LEMDRRTVLRAWAINDEYPQAVMAVQVYAGHGAPHPAQALWSPHACAVLGALQREDLPAGKHQACGLCQGGSALSRPFPLVSHLPIVGKMIRSAIARRSCVSRSCATRSWPPLRSVQVEGCVLQAIARWAVLVAEGPRLRQAPPRSSPTWRMAGLKFPTTPPPRLATCQGFSPPPRLLFLGKQARRQEA
jgi:hypothetical protein